MDIYAIRKHNLVKLIGNQRKGACAERWGMAPAHLSQILSDKTAKNLGDDVARRIENVEGLPRGWFDSVRLEEPVENAGLTGNHPASTPNEDAPSVSAADVVKQMLATQGRNLSAQARARLLAAADEPAVMADADFTRPGLVGDEIWIAHYDVQAAMGSSQASRDYPQMLQDVRVSPRHLRESGVEFADHVHLKLLTGWGQSMAPTIKHRDPLLVDVSIRAFVGDGVYLISHGELLYIKRLQKKGRDHFKMISDNTNHPAEDVRIDEICIQAKVLLVLNAYLV